MASITFRLLFTTLFAVFGLLPTITLAFPLATKSSPPPTTNLTEIWQFSNGTWAENLAVRPASSGGSILVTILAQPHPYASLYLVDPTQRHAAVVVHEFDSYSSISGIVQNPPASDIYYVAVGNASFLPFSFFPVSWSIYQVDMRGYTFEANASIPKVKLVSKLPYINLPNGLAALDDNNILIAASVEGVVLKVNTKTGAVSTVLSGPLFAAPANSSFPLGVNGLKLRGSTLYWTNTAREIIGRVELNPNGTAKSTPVVLANVADIDDLIITGKEIITAGPVLTSVQLANGKQSVISNSTLLEAATALQPASEECEDGIFYVSTSGGEGQYYTGQFTNPGKVLRLSIGGTGKQH